MHRFPPLLPAAEYTFFLKKIPAAAETGDEVKEWGGRNLFYPPACFSACARHVCLWADVREVGGVEQHFIRLMQWPRQLPVCIRKTHGDTSCSSRPAAFARSWALLENGARAIPFKLQNRVLLPRKALRTVRPACRASSNAAASICKTFTAALFFRKMRAWNLHRKLLTL